MSERSGFLLRLFASGLLCLCACADTPDLSKLPDWAAAAVVESRSVPTPEQADAWVLLDRTEFAYTGDGEIRQHRFRVVQILGEQGLGEAYFTLFGEGASTTKVKKLRGWNLRPDGDVERLSLDDALTLQGVAGDDGSYSTRRVTQAQLPRTVKGSLVAFESLEVVKEPLGPIHTLLPFESNPVLRWECEAGKKEGWFSNLKAVECRMDLVGTRGWGLRIQQAPGSVTILNLPRIPKPEPFQPPYEECLPQVRIRFIDPAQIYTPLWSSWDGLARFTYAAFQASDLEGLPPDSPDPDPVTKLKHLLTWMDAHFTYRQVYMSASRDWIPEKIPEIGRKRYGDCKDFATYLIADAQRVGLKAFPVLAAINNARMNPDVPPGDGFNHALVAIKLDRTRGLPAEVQTSEGRFLLVDPTDHYTPFGQLGGYHRGRWVMICLPSKASWVQIPDSGVVAESLKFHLAGDLGEDGRLKGRLRLEECGNASGIRAMATETDPKAFLQWLRSSVLSLPAAATCDLISHSQVSDLTSPFVMELDVTVPDSADSDASELDIRLPGFPPLPPRAESTGVLRALPLVSLAAKHLTYQADLRLAKPVSPLLPTWTAATCRRRLTWSAKADAAASRNLSLTLQEECLPCGFDMTQRQEGVKAFTADRAAVLKLRQDGLAFKIQP